MVFVCTYTCYLVDVFFSGITDENKSEENEISLLSLGKTQIDQIFFSSSSLLMFDFCKRKVVVAQTRRIFDKSHHHKHSKKTETKFSLSSLSLCFHDNRRTTLLIRFETNFSILVALHIRVVINAAVLFLSSSHFENERVGERECREKREGIIILLRV